MKMRLPGREIYYYDTVNGFETEKFASRLLMLILDEMQAAGKTEILFLCIGTDRSTGDSLGPLIGYKLKEYGIPHARVCGTLDEPIHAMNFEESVERIRNLFPNAVVVAIDASVGNAGHVGYVTLGRGPIRPGLGVRKDLNAVGDIFITGIVGSSRNGDPLVLQNVRLSVVMRLADCICRSICLGMKLIGERGEVSKSFWDRAPGFDRFCDPDMLYFRINEKAGDAC